MLYPTSVRICLPVYFHTQKVKSCIASLLACTPSSEMLVEVCIGVNGADPELKSFLSTIDISGTGIDSLTVTYFGRNIGKGACVNSLAKSFEGSSSGFIISMDSDIVVKDTNWLPGLIRAYRVSHMYEIVGGIAADQEGQCCHVDSGYAAITYDGVHFRKYDGNNGVAGGLLLIPSRVWESVGGYRAHNLYGSDDGHFGQDCACRGMSVLLCKSVVVFHPSEENPDYAQWKVRSVRNTLQDQEKQGFVFNNVME